MSIKLFRDCIFKVSEEVSLHLRRVTAHLYIEMSILNKVIRVDKAVSPRYLKSFFLIVLIDV